MLYICDTFLTRAIIHETAMSVNLQAPLASVGYPCDYACREQDFKLVRALVPPFQKDKLYLALMTKDEIL